MSVYLEEQYPWLNPEKEFVNEVIKSGKPILRSCFGAQRIADVLGGNITKNRFEEIGWHNVRFTNRFTNQRLTTKLTTKISLNKEIESGLPGGLPPEFTGFMWHGDTLKSRLEQ